MSTPKFKEGALSRPCCSNVCIHKRRTTHITSLCLLIALCCFAFSPSSCFCPLSACFGARPLLHCFSVYITMLKRSHVNKHLLMEMQQTTAINLWVLLWCTGVTRIISVKTGSGLSGILCGSCTTVTVMDS